MKGGFVHTSLFGRAIDRIVDHALNKGNIRLDRAQRIDGEPAKFWVSDNINIDPRFHRKPKTMLGNGKFYTNF